MSYTDTALRGNIYLYSCLQQSLDQLVYYFILEYGPLSILSSNADLLKHLRTSSDRFISGIWLIFVKTRKRQDGEPLI